LAKQDQLSKATALYKKGDPDAAAELLEHLVEREPGNIQAHLLLARCYSRMRLGEDAVSEIEEALSLDPDNPEALTLRGAEHYFADEMVEADDKLTRAIELDPSRVEAYVRQAQVRTDMKKFDEAEELLRQAEERAATDPDAQARVLMGKVYLAMQRREHAKALELIEQNESLLADHPYEAATVRSNQAVIYARQRDYDRARSLLVDALDLDPYFRSARVLLGQIALLQKDYELAADQLGQVSENGDEPDPQVEYSLATALQALKRNAEATEHYRAAVKAGLTGLPAITAGLAAAVPNLNIRIGILVVLLVAVAALLSLVVKQVLFLLAIVGMLGVLGWQIIRGGR